MLIDCDVHPITRSGWLDIAPYVPANWRERLEIAFNSKDLGLGVTPPPIGGAGAAAAFAADAIGPDGSRPGSDPAFVREHFLDAHNVDAAILESIEIIYLSSLGKPDEAAHLTRAFNDFFMETWLPVDDRYRFAIGVTPLDPEWSAGEIRRLGSERGVVGVLLPYTHLLLGHHHYFPIYEAAEEASLPILLHPGQGQYFGTPVRTAAGVVSSYLQLHTLLCQQGMVNVVSLVAEGVFQRFPGLKVVFAEYGFSWLVHLMWRFDTEWRSLFGDAPWLSEPPSTYIRKHLRFTTQPIDQPENKKDLPRVVEMIHGDEILMFSSDYPHWDNEFSDNALDGLPEATRRRVFYETALETFSRLADLGPASRGLASAVAD